MPQPVLVDRIGHIAILTLDHSPANTMTPASLAILAGHLKTLSADDTVRAVVMTGKGERFFCAGLDVRLLNGADRQQTESLLVAFTAMLDAIREFSGVTVAAINGFALGGGLEWALACDYRVAERGASLGMPEARLGLLPAGGGTRMLVDAVGAAWARRIILGGERVDAETAWRIGLVEEVVDPGCAKIVAISLAGRVGRQGRQAVAVARSLIDSARDVSFDEARRRERSAFLALCGAAEPREGIAAFLAKRPPSWSDEDDPEDE
ncbi:enoyl-CoA hydratase [Paludibacterium paludis]|uniref:Enoyl-CoA hydratase n=1 Tax=Paludibacterium paludis TaxID=1225769 RepID=A0A918P3R7_9NEIS|nr:enoyl-CoA hydratase [Paludibacterium paludis]GGY19292.1 enoyl-CoA hydratase [Paludibacterium paludis]